MITRRTLLGSLAFAGLVPPTPTLAWLIEVDYIAEADTLFAAMSSQPADSRKALINSTIQRLKTAGIWSKLDVLYLFAAHNEADSLINIRNPGTHNLVLTNGPPNPTFTVDLGWIGNDPDVGYLAATSYNTGGGNQAQLDSCHIGCGISTHHSQDDTDFHVEGSVNDLRLRAYNSGDLLFLKANDNSNALVTNTNAIGRYVGNRSASNARQVYKNGAEIFNDTIASAGTTDQGIRAAQPNRRIWYGHIGASLNASEVVALDAIMYVYGKSVGAI